jgi:hypothetical protein
MQNQLYYITMNMNVVNSFVGGKFLHQFTDFVYNSVQECQP